MSDQRGIEYLNEVLQDNGRLRVRQSVGSGFNIWKSKAGAYIVFTLLVMIILTILSMIPFIGQIANNILLGPPLTLGAYMYTNKVERGHDVELGNFMDGFNFFGTVAIARVLIFIVVFLLSMLLFRNVFAGNWIDVMTGNTEFITAGMLDEDFEFTDIMNIDNMTLVYIIPLYLFSMMIYFTECFIAFFGLNAMDAINYSCRFVIKNIFKVIVLFILVMIIVLSGIIGIFIGVLITYSMIFPMFYRAFVLMTDYENYQKDEDDHGLRIEDTLVGE